jgi:hypothetical protein
MIDLANGLSDSVDFDGAVDLMLAEIGEATPIDDEAALPAADSDASFEIDDAVSDDTDDGSEQPEAPEEFDFDAPQAGAEDGLAPEALGDDTLVSVPGRAEPVPLGELRNGYMRQADYTRKTQELAEQQRQLEAQMTPDDRGNAELWESMKEDPIGTVRYLARHLGADDVEQSLTKLNDVGFVPRSEVQRVIQEQVALAVQQHPAVQQAQVQRFQAQLDHSWRSIEAKVGKPLSESAKVKVLNFAVENQIANVELAFDALSARMGTKTPARRNLDDSKPQKRQNFTREGGASRRKPNEVLDFNQSIEAALADLEGMAEV